MFCPHCEAKLTGHPTKCPMCSGEIAYGDADFSVNHKLGKMFAIMGAIVLPVAGIYVDLEINVLWLILIGAVGGYLFPYTWARKG